MASKEEIDRAIKATEYKYFGDYEMSDDQRDAVDILVEAAKAHLGQKGDPVAFLYNSDGGDQELIFNCNGDHARLLLEGGWTETPLYK